MVMIIALALGAGANCVAHMHPALRSRIFEASRGRSRYGLLGAVVATALLAVLPVVLVGITAIAIYLGTTAATLNQLLVGDALASAFLSTLLFAVGWGVTELAWRGVEAPSYSGRRW